MLRSIWDWGKPSDALQTVVALWFGVMLIGQWLFVAYIVGFYGRLTLYGGLPEWEKTHLPNGYIANDTIGNLTLVLHALLPIAIHGFGPLQLISKIRNKHRNFHRWNGRVFVALCILVTTGGLYLTWCRPIGFGGVSGQITITIVAFLVYITAFQTIRYAIRRDLTQHKNWAIRLFLVASAVWFARLIMYGGISVSNAMGFEYQEVKDHLIQTSQIGQFLLPLLVFQYYLYAGRSTTLSVKRFAMLLILIASVAMLVGIYAVTMNAWIPRIMSNF